MTMFPKDENYGIMCDCLRPGCHYCDSDGTLSQFYNKQLSIIRKRMGNPVYLIEFDGPIWLHEDEIHLTTDANEALFFDEETIAKLYLHFNKDKYRLPSVKITEHIFPYIK